MTPHPTRLAVLISLVGVGLSAGSNAVARHESARAEMARVLHALALDAAEHAAAINSHAWRRPEPSAAPLERLHEPLAFLDWGPIGPDVPRAEANDAPPAPGPLPNPPVDPSGPMGPPVRPIDEPDATAVPADDVPTVDVPVEDALERSERTMQAEPPADQPAHAPWDGETVAVDASRLDQVRGGFVAHTGLTLSFGIERAVYINGTLVTTTALNVSDLSKLSAGQATLASLNGGTLAVLQSGNGNTFLPGAVSASTIGTVIQNTLDNQHIQSVTTINATVNSGEIVRSMNLQQSVQNAINFSRR